YSVPVRTRTKLRQLAQLGREKPWWERAGLARALREYIGFEQAATAIMTYGSIVPGLLQTRAYCEAMLERTAIESPEMHEVTVQHRLRRQELLDRADPPWLWVILDESVLHRRTGGTATMQEQLAALLKSADRPRVSVRILPFAAGAHPGMDSRFVMVSTRPDHAPELVYVEGLSGTRSLFEDDDLARYTASWHTLSSLALSEEESKSMLVRAIHPELVEE